MIHQLHAVSSISFFRVYLDQHMEEVFLSVWYPKGQSKNLQLAPGEFPDNMRLCIFPLNNMERSTCKSDFLKLSPCWDQIANYKFSVTGHGEVATVDLQRRTCTCRIFDLDKIPCPHAMAAIRSQHGDDFRNHIYLFSSPYYLVEKYIMAYCQKIHPVSTEDSWIVPLNII